ncbi:gluconate 2-dehydrogenase subunit 3 family protein [Noviherbaspirillum pedocola]|uniref:gluconate 2-dehydrogenase subunit 3 family protein n=1 Tax=Noviherbaspirillum pedocola TaxID=2801341 RepID=UPI001F1DA658|nr:gluconate 2-dehydrogenase subunit 3 family protein [Noviherbaspirillum pedocola]
MMMDKLSRRSFFKAAGVGAAALTAQAQALKAAAAPAQHHAPSHDHDEAAQSGGYLFFRTDELRFIEAATERLIPADANGPGAIEADVPRYLDRQLAGAWGAGERLYRSGPWHEGEPTQGYQLPYTPAELFRNALRGVAADVQKKHGNSFDKLSGADQDAYLQELQKSKEEMNGVPANVFFESLLAMTIEGFFSDPIYGGNKDMVSWKMIGFPGAYATFYEQVDKHGIAFTRPPISIGDNGRGVIRLHAVKDPVAPSKDAAVKKGGK